MSADLIAEARRFASFAPDKPESVHDVVCAGFNELTEQLAARTRDFLAAVERNEEKDRRISDLEEQLEAERRANTGLSADLTRFGEALTEILDRPHGEIDEHDMRSIAHAALNPATKAEARDSGITLDFARGEVRKDSDPASEPESS